MEIDDDIERRLNNWAMYKVSGTVTGSLSPYPIYNKAGRGNRSENIMPILIAEAEETDDLIKALRLHDQRLARVLEIEYLETYRHCYAKWKAAGCTDKTYKTRLIRAKSLLREKIVEKNEKQTLITKIKLKLIKAFGA